ncbi:MAG TPA: hypothetical protein PLH57_00150, partial [Oligoflexia bacterium]|nr:hypothetical protein [Oligoflexia bacterium]
MKTEKNLKDQKSQLDQLITILMSCFAELGVRPNSLFIEDTAVMIYDAMSTRTRLYHRLEHCLSTPPNVDALGILAYLFHDVIYWQVDRARSSKLRQGIAPLELDDHGTVTLTGECGELGTAKISERNTLARLVFGFNEPVELDFSHGMNEFLSACVAENTFKGLLDTWQIVQILCCIEATIPFRPALDGKTAIEKLAARLKKINIGYAFGKTEEEQKQAIRRAIDVANHDVGNFAYATTSTFLKNTWDLTWENNPALQRDTYSIKQYRSALQANIAFYRSLQPRYVFSCLDGYPTRGHFEDIVGRTKKNITTGLQYIQVKLVACAIIESVADLTGGDAPLMLFMGNHSQQGLIPKWADLLENIDPTIIKDELRKDVFKLLFEGRPEMKEQFDVARSPISAHLYASLDAANFQKAAALADEFFVQRMSAKEFLQANPINLVYGPVLEKFKEIVSSRKEALSALEKELR